ncbi:MAG TPA: glycoside hydrolase family 9 protein, partial [Herpetosiphonaceae bacterium]|nr:glycoside hydrolase family 9 protein [Herpetosiphonaceae bacterium]
MNLNELGYFETRGLNVLAFSNWYDGLFSDAKIAGIELIHHDVRTATNGDVRLSPTPGQWDVLPQLVERRVHPETRRVETVLTYADYDLRYTLRAEAYEDGVRVSVHLEQPLPRGLEGRAGFNLEFLPSAYFGKAYLMDGEAGSFPRYPAGPMAPGSGGTAEPLPFATGKTIVLAPEDPRRHVTVKATDGELMLFDGRNTAQNGWYVLRSLLPAGRAGQVVEWLVTAGTIPDWVRTPVIAHSQVGYHPDQQKLAVIELDKNDRPLASARLLKVADTGAIVEHYAGELQSGGGYLRYQYATFDFSAVTDAGLYVLEYGGVRTHPFRIARGVYEDAWYPTLDVFFPVQMDHMFVREAHRVWHGVSHLDDALQAPVSHEHFDLYAQGPTTDTPYQPGEHIPGLNIGGWFDAGDFDIRTQIQYATLIDLVQIWERFGIRRDETTVDQGRRRVEIHVPDGIPDLLQQIEHGTLALIAQHRAVGHAIPGIVEPTLQQYTHLGDAASKTDNLPYKSDLQEGESDGFHSGTFDDRWAFTSVSTPLNYGSIAALAAAGRALRGFRDELADECLATAKRVWDEEHAHAPVLFHHGNTTGGGLEEEELKAAVELLVTTQDPRYAQRIEELWPAVDRSFHANAALAIRALPYLGESYRQQ